MGLGKIESKTDDAINTIEDIDDITDAEIEEIARKAIVPVIPVAKQMLLENLRRSKIGTLTPSDKYKHTGKIAAAVQAATIGVKMRGRVPRIVAAMPSGISPYDNGGGRKSDFYEVAASLSYGAVRTARERRAVVDLPTGKIKVEKRSVIGERAKRTVKKFALGEAVSERAINAVEEGRAFAKFSKFSSEQKPKKKPKKKIIKGFNIGSVKKETSSSVSMTGGAVIIKPRPFFEFTQSQQDQLSQLFADQFMEILLDDFRKR